MTGKGAGLGVPSLGALVPPVIVQLQNSDGHCWEASYSAPAAIEESKFKGKSDPESKP